MKFYNRGNGQFNRRDTENTEKETGFQELRIKLINRKTQRTPRLSGEFSMAICLRVLKNSPWRVWFFALGCFFTFMATHIQIDLPDLQSRLRQLGRFL